MIAHVAEAGERRGRVVLQLTPGQPNQVALEAAIRVAKAFQSELESLFVEDDSLLDVAGYSFAREISLSGRHRREITAEGMARQMRHMANALSRQLVKLARMAEVPLRHSVVRDEPVAALARACSEHGPWNVVALGYTVGAGTGCPLGHLFERVAGTTGVVFAGPKARRSDGPLVVVLEDIAYLEPLLRAAERLLPPDAKDDSITLLIVADSEDKCSWTESQVRLALAASPLVTIEKAIAALGGEAAVAEALRKLKGGFVIGQFGGLLAPPDTDARHLTQTLECPLFLMR